MIKTEITIGRDLTADASPIALLVQTANRYASAVYLESGEKRINAKSMMGMMTLRLLYGEKMTIETDGEDEEEANRAVADFLKG